MALLYKYGSIDPVPFKVTKNGEGLAGFTFATGDITLSVDGGASANIDTEVAESTFAKGWYIWTPTAAATQTQGNFAIINVKQLAGTDYDENGVVLQFGGNASAWLDG